MAHAANIKQPIQGTEALREVLRRVPAAIRNEILGQMVSDGSKPLRDAIKARTPKITGALQKSISTVVRHYRGSGSAVAVTGPDSHYYSSGKRVKRGADRSGANRPAKYAHLVEFGFHTRTKAEDSPNSFRPGERRRGLTKRGKQVVTFVPPRPFMRSGFAASKSQVGAAMESSFLRGLDRVTGKGAPGAKR